MARKTEIDYMEYSSDALAQAAYVSSDADGIDQSNETHDSTTTLGDAAGVEYRQAQSFQLSESQKVSAVSFEVQSSVGTPTQTVTARIETDNAGVPSGTLADANLTKQITNFTTGWYKFSFDTAATLNASTTYWIVLDIADQADDKRWILYCDDQSGYANGEWKYTAAAGPWTSQDGRDLSFRVYTVVTQCYSESTIKQQGSYSLKGVAKQTDSLNDTLTRTVSPTIDLSNKNLISLYVRASRTGSNFKIGFHDSGGTTTEKTIAISSADTWERKFINLEGVTNSNKDVIDSIIITITNADADNTIYVDDIYSLMGENTNAFGTNF